jgi:hypothetical protein
VVVFKASPKKKKKKKRSTYPSAVIMSFFPRDHRIHSSAAHTVLEDRQQPNLWHVAAAAGSTLAVIGGVVFYFWRRKHKQDDTVDVHDESPTDTNVDGHDNGLSV